MCRKILLVGIKQEIHVHVNTLIVSEAYVTKIIEINYVTRFTGSALFEIIFKICKVCMVLCQKIDSFTFN